MNTNLHTIHHHGFALWRRYPAGFRNIQNVVRKCKTMRGGGYHFVEIMACPSGCLNGGGQLPPPPAVAPGTRFDPNNLPTSLGGMSAKQLVDHLEELYHGGGGGAGTGAGAGVGPIVVPRHPSLNPEVAALYRDWVGGDVGSAPARYLLHTRWGSQGGGGRTLLRVCLNTPVKSIISPPIEPMLFIVSLKRVQFLAD